MVSISFPVQSPRTGGKGKVLDRGKPGQLEGGNVGRRSEYAPPGVSL